MARPRLLDLFCGAGGAAMGYYRAGFDVTGVDSRPQPRYPFAFHQADAMTWPLEGYDVIHASPPCQAYTRSGGRVARDGRHPDLLASTRTRLLSAGVPYVIENVPGAPMRPDVILCGSMFGLAIRRHRWFESSAELLPWFLSCDHGRPITGVYGHAHGERGARRGMLPSDLSTWSRAMGIEWMTSAELSAAIPPAYTERIGRQLLELVEAAA